MTDHSELREKFACPACAGTRVVRRYSPGGGVEPVPCIACQPTKPLGEKVETTLDFRDIRSMRLDQIPDYVLSLEKIIRERTPVRIAGHDNYAHLHQRIKTLETYFNILRVATDPSCPSLMNTAQVHNYLKSIYEQEGWANPLTHEGALHGSHT